jgi:hypothetical protein
LILTVNTYLFKYVPVKLGFIILSLIGVLRIPEEFYLYKDKDKDIASWYFRLDHIKIQSTCNYFLFPKLLLNALPNTRCILKMVSDNRIDAKIRELSFFRKAKLFVFYDSVYLSCCKKLKRNLKCCNVYKYAETTILQHTFYTF